MTLKIIDNDRHCQHCGAPFNRRDGENRHDYLRRKACSRACSLKIIHGKPAVRIIRAHEAMITLAAAMQGWRSAA